MLNIREKRLALGIAQKELADKLGVARTTVAMWETGRRNPGVSELPKVAAALECDISELFAPIEEVPAQRKQRAKEFGHTATGKEIYHA